MTTCYENVLNRIRSCVADNKIWVSMDETSDAVGRYVANVVVGVLREDRPGEKFLISCEALERTNHSTIAVTFDNALNLLWPEGVKRENVLLLVTDAAPYMVKAGKGLQLLYPKMIHVTCIAHALHRVAEEIRGNYPDVDKLIATVKKTFIKAPLRVQKFKEIASSVPLPPEPILTRWGTWLNAANYYCTNYNVIEDIVNEFNEGEASSIKTAKTLFSSSTSLILSPILV